MPSGHWRKVNGETQICADRAGSVVTKELVDYEGDSLKSEGDFVYITDEGNYRTAIIRLAEGQSVKRVD